MGNTEVTSPLSLDKGDGGGEPPENEQDVAGLEAGLDALDTVIAAERTPWWRTILAKVVPPLCAIGLVLAVWQIAYSADVAPDYKLPSPGQVWDAFMVQWRAGEVHKILWVSVERAWLGFLLAIALGTPLGLIVARVKVIRAAIGPILTGLQSLPSVAWVPLAVIWFGQNNTAIYAVVLLGAIPSIANGLVSGVDQVPPLFIRAGRVLGATGIKGVRYVLLPAAMPGYLAGLKQGWAFTWRSLMAAELIVGVGEYGFGVGQLLEQGRTLGDMPMMLTAVFMILLVGIGIELLIFNPLERLVLRQRGLLVTTK
ncbi:ABC transporter permease [Yinghuangia sp. ASG 101]|uniref:ABC transporter permease n=1 Tax=Yinghuangia sp. ASG 101 TaxID=2896848 RepID=UPI001E4CA893|nr:ABC transporter permease [Yinghuangia sp. ASG 101]UGQ13770.1 ABC transporter permease [Yinghuangia sp. ASG 101]